jgi:hypothetical protein
VRSLREPVTLAVSADDPEMSYTFMIVPLRNGHFRAEKVEKGDQATSYVSATFRSKREALEWIERQTRVPRELRIDYIVTPTDSGTHCVTLVRTDRENPEMLGEFSTVEDANEFIRRMRQLDAGPSHGGNP